MKHGTEQSSLFEAFESQGASAQGTILASPPIGSSPQGLAQDAPRAYARRPGRCLVEMKFWTGNVAVRVGPVEIERAPHMIYILSVGKLLYTFSADHAPDLDKFAQHFRED